MLKTDIFFGNNNLYVVLATSFEGVLNSQRIIRVIVEELEKIVVLWILATGVIKSIKYLD